MHVVVFQVQLTHPCGMVILKQLFIGGLNLQALNAWTIYSREGFLFVFFFPFQIYGNVHLICVRKECIKDNWLCRGCLLLPKGHFQPYYNHFLKGTNFKAFNWAFFAMSNLHFSHMTVLIFKVFLDRSSCWEAIRNKNCPSEIVTV